MEKCETQILMTVVRVSSVWGSVRAEESLLLVDMVQRQPATSDQPIDVDQLSAADILCHAK